MYYGHMSSFGWIGGWFFMVLFWGAVIWLIIWLINKGQNNCKKIHRTPLEIAKERYAKGEISKKEFDYMKKELRG